VAAVTGEHAEMVAELKALAETVLERIEPILQKAARGAEAAAESDGPESAGQTGCSSCSWCPLCALAALIRGEQHDLVTAVAGHASALLAVLREVLDGQQDAAAARAGQVPEPTEQASAFVPIHITIKD